MVLPYKLCALRTKTMSLGKVKMRLCHTAYQTLIRNYMQGTMCVCVCVGTGVGTGDEDAFVIRLLDH